jgi:hypothetical protein
MKIRLPLIFAAVLAVSLIHSPGTQAEGLEYQLRLGLCGSRFSAADMSTAEGSPRFGFYASGAIIRPLINGVDLQIELAWVQQGEKQKDSSSYYGGHIVIDEDIRVTYLEMPILFRMPLDTNGTTFSSLIFGPSVSFFASGKRSGSYAFTGSVLTNPVEYDDPVGNERKFNLGLVFGFSFKVGSGSSRIAVDIRYSRDLFNPFEDIEPGSAYPAGESPLAVLPSGDALGHQNRKLVFSVGISF